MIAMSQSKVLDLKGFVCPFTQIKTLEALHRAPSGTVLNVLVDNLESLESIEIAAENAGYKVEQVMQNGNVFTIKISKTKKEE